MIINEKKMAQLAINKSLLKEYSTNEDSRVVYMDNNDEFQIQLFNPEQFTIGITFTFNGKDMDGMLVLKPGERVWLERYLDNQVKFKFYTYEVDDNDVQVKHAIANNGNITVKFYKERVSSRIKTNIYNTLDVLWKESPLISNENTYTVPSYDTVVTCSDTNNNVLTAVVQVLMEIHIIKLYIKLMLMILLLKQVELKMVVIQIRNLKQ